MSHSANATSSAGDMIRSSSRTGSISTLWISADIPFCLDPRVDRTGTDNNNRSPPRSSINRYPKWSTSPSREHSVDLDQRSISLFDGDSCFARPQSVQASPPRVPTSISSFFRRDPSILIENASDSNFDDSPPRWTNSSQRSSPLKKSPQSHTSSRHYVTHLVEEDSSQVMDLSDNFVASGSSHWTSTPLNQSCSSTLPDKLASDQLDSSGDTQTETSHLYAKAGRLGDRANINSAGRLPVTESVNRPTPSDSSHVGSTPSCSRSHRTSSDESMGSIQQEQTAAINPDFYSGQPCQFGLDSAFQQTAPNQNHANRLASANSADRELSLFSSIAPALRESPRGFAARHGARPRTAESPINGSPNSSPVKRVVKGPPTPIKISHPTAEQITLPTQQLDMSLDWDQPKAENVSSRAKISSLGPKLRSRAMSTSKLKPASPWKAIPPSNIPALPVNHSQAAVERPSTCQIEPVPTASKMAGRFRSRTLGEADRSSTIHTPIHLIERAEDQTEGSSGDSPSFLARQQRMRRPSKAETLASSVNSSARSFLLTPRSSYCNVSPSPATSAPLTPKSPARTRAKTNTGWASYLGSGLTLHIDQEGYRSAQTTMSYLSYDPFGRPEMLANQSEPKHSTPKRPKSRGEKDNESEQVGTLEFGQGDEVHQHILPFLSSRKGFAPILRHLTIGEDIKADLLTRQVTLSVQTNGVHEVSGHERKGQLAWRFTYKVENHPTSEDDKNLIPISFSCSATLLDPARARKSRILNMMKKQVAPNLISNPVALVSPASFKQEVPHISDSVVPSPVSVSSQQSHRKLRNESGVQERILHLKRSSHHDSNTCSPASMHQLLEPSFNLSPANTHNTSTLSPSGVFKATSIASSDSSLATASHPLTPASARGANEPLQHRLKLQDSPVSPIFGQKSLQIHDRRVGDCGLSVVRDPSNEHPVDQLGLIGLGSSLVNRSTLSLQEDATQHRPIQTGPPKFINGKKLIPITLPPELQRRTKIDPSQLRASTATRTEGEPLKPTLTPSKTLTDSSEPNQKRHSGRRRSNTHGAPTNRPLTASEAVKLEYLAREASQDSCLDAPSTYVPRLRGQKSHGTFVLTSKNFQDNQQYQVAGSRQRSRTSGTENGPLSRPFTADAWGESMYPPLDVVSGVLLGHIRKQDELATHLNCQAGFPAGAFPGQSGSASQRTSREHRYPQSPPVIVPRGSSMRPHTAQNIVADHHGSVVSGALVDYSRTKINV